MHRRFRQDQRKTEDTGEDQGTHPEHADRRHGIEQGTSTHHGNDEADRPPQADAAIASAFLAQVIESQHLDQRQRAAPEEGKNRHRQQHAGQTIEPEESGEPRQTNQTGEADDQHAVAEAVGHPAPEIGTEQAHQLHLRHQQADVPGGKSARLQVEPEVRGKRADEGEVEEIVARQGPAACKLHPASGSAPVAGGCRLISPTAGRHGRRASGGKARPSA
ncbi:hypothetical protein SDC9_150991 [bioreactor metagenome]|uniref:Uncharacterized protein n=1 Tax=bioreactor metagenome TaxID=1076179 RepID=A0A645EPL4_9ZZZZ